jgi:hypothetical protein
LVTSEAAKVIVQQMPTVISRHLNLFVHHFVMDVEERARNLNCLTINAVMMMTALGHKTLQ